MRIPSGVTDQYVYFVAVDSTDFATRETGLSSFTVYRSRDGAAAAAMTTPTVNETDATNMQGVYELLLDEDMTIGSGNDSEEMVFHITATGMAPVTRTIELYRPKITAGYTLGTGSDGDLLEVNTLTGHTVQTGDSFARIGATGSGLTTLATAAALTTVDTVVDGVQTDLSNATDGLGAIKTAVDTVDGIVDSILVDTAEIGTAGAGLTAVPWNTAWAAPVNAEADTALSDYDPPTNAEMEARTILAASYFDPAADTVANVTTVATVTNEVDADITKISGSATAADNLEASALGIVTGACEGTPTTTVVQTDLAEATDDHYIGRVIVFTSGNAAGEATDITDYTGSSGTVTVTALTTAPAAADTFVIV